METDYWFRHHSGDLPPLLSDERQVVKTITGCLPLLLRLLRNFKDRKFNEIDFRAMLENECHVNLNVALFFKYQISNLKLNEINSYV